MTYYPHQVAFRTQDLPGQFILTRREDLVPRGWRTVDHGPWILGYATPLIWTPVRDPSGAPWGWVLGHAVDAEGRYLHPEQASDLTAPQSAGFDAVMGRLTGRFLGLDLSGADPHLHLDPLGTLAAVYAPEDQVVASTSSLIPRSDHTPFLVDRIIATDIPYAEGIYPLGLTPRRGVERVLPNHVLDLGTWRLVRRWPTAMWRRDTDAARVVGLMRDTVRGALEGIRAVHRPDLTLTAGYDSRMMLACARDLRHDLSCFTGDLGDEVSWRDVQVARAITGRFEIAHRVLEKRAPRRSDLRLWVARTGGETGEPRGWRGCRTLERQMAGRATITGASGEISKLGGWRRRFLATRVTPVDLLDRCKAPLIPEFVQRVERWLGALPELDPLAVADLAHIEQVLGCWGGVIEYGELGSSSARLSPACARPVVEACLRLDIAYRLDRAGKRLHADVIAAAWPELLEFPFNEESAIPSRRARSFALHQQLRRKATPVLRAWRKARTSPRWLIGRLMRSGS